MGTFSIWYIKATFKLLESLNSLVTGQKIQLILPTSIELKGISNKYARSKLLDTKQITHPESSVSQRELGVEGRKITVISFLYGFIVQESFQVHFQWQYNNFWPTIASFLYMKQVAFIGKLSSSTHMVHMEGPKLAFFFFYSIFLQGI